MYYPWMQMLLVANGGFLLANYCFPEVDHTIILLILGVINIIYSFTTLTIENKKRGINIWTGRR